LKVEGNGKKKEKDKAEAQRLSKTSSKIRKQDTVREGLGRRKYLSRGRCPLIMGRSSLIVGKA
jgi:hypothetical protein